MQIKVAAIIFHSVHFQDEIIEDLHRQRMNIMHVRRTRVVQRKALQRIVQAEKVLEEERRQHRTVNQQEMTSKGGGFNALVPLGRWDILKA